MIGVSHIDNVDVFDEREVSQERKGNPGIQSLLNVVCVLTMDG